MLPQQPDRRPSFWRGVARLCGFDLRRFRVPIAAVAGLELLRGVLAESTLHGAPFGNHVLIDGDRVASELQTVDGALMIAAVIVTALVVQADHPTDDRGFLRSRPVAAWQLATAKLTLLGALLVLVPFLVTAARLLASDAPATSLLASAVQFAVTGGSLALPAWALALITRTLPGFLATATGIVMVWFVGRAALLSYGLWRWFDESSLFRTLGGFDRRRRTLYRLAARRGPRLVVRAGDDGRGGGHPHELLPEPARARRDGRRARPRPAARRAPAWDAEDPASPDLAAIVAADARLDALVVPLAGAAAQIGASGRWTKGAVSGRITIASLPPNVSTEREIGDVRVSAPGLRIVEQGLPYCCDNAAFRASAAAAGAPVDDPSTWAGPGRPGEAALFLAPLAQIEAMRGRRVDVEVDLGVRFTRHVLVADIPLRAGAAVRTADAFIEVVAVDFARKDIRCRFTRFPTLARSRPLLWTFVDHPQTGIVRSLGLREQERGLDTNDLGWARGRTWSRLARLPILDLPAAPPAPRLRIVESRPAGETSTRLTARDVPVWTAELGVTAAPRNHRYAVPARQ